MRLRVYLSGGMHSDWRWQVRRGCPDHVYIHPEDHNLALPMDYAMADILGIRQCDVVLAYMEGDNPSGIGLAFEVGYALALGKTVILVNESSAPYFGILDASVTNTCKDLPEAVRVLRALGNM